MTNYINKPDIIPEQKTYTVKDIARILNISERSAYNFCTETVEFGVKRIGRLIRIEKMSFDSWFIGTK